jgi:hypothetical protein
MAITGVPGTPHSFLSISLERLADGDGWPGKRGDLWPLGSPAEVLGPELAPSRPTMPRQDRTHPEGFAPSRGKGARALFCRQPGYPVKGEASETATRPHGSLFLGALSEVCVGAGLATGGVLTQLLEEGSQRVQFRTKAGPVAGSQLLDSAIVVAQRLPRPIGLGAGERDFG